MNNLGTIEQGKKVWDNITRKLDRSEGLTGFIMKDPDFFNLMKFLRNTGGKNRLLRVTLMENYISFTYRNIYPANVTAVFREVRITRKRRSL